MKRSLTLFLLAITFTTLFAQDTYNCYIHDELAPPREHTVDFTALDLSVSFEPRAGKVKGEVLEDFRVLREQVDSLFLDAPGITFSEVQLDEMKVNFKTNALGITIYSNAPLKFGTEHRLRMVYEAAPKKGIYFIGWNDPTNRLRKQIWTQGQGVDNRYWIPCYDTENDKLNTSMTVRFDSRYQVLSNGREISRTDNGDGTTTWKFRLEDRSANPVPQTTYLIMLGIGEYKVQESLSKGGIQIRNWYYPDHADRAQNSFRHTADMMDFLEKETGTPYPWGKTYSQIPVANFLYGAMENTTATIFGDFFMTDERDFPENNYVGVNIHEMTHQWFGDYVTARSDAYHWLHESFATYFGTLYRREAFGQDDYQWGRRGEALSAFQASKTDERPISHASAGGSRHYPKGSFVIGMLRYVIGDAAFQRVLKRYLQTFGYRNADTHEFMNVIHDETGMTLNWFVDQWIMRGGEPHYEVSWSEAKNASGKEVTRFAVNQTHPQTETVKLFRMPINFEVHYQDGSVDQKQAWIEKQSESVDIANPKGKKVEFILFDPNSQILKTYEVHNTLEQWAAQAEKASNMIDRHDALEAICKLPLDQTRELLYKLYDKETFHACKAVIIAALANDPDKQSHKLLQKALEDKDRFVRFAAVEKINAIPDGMENHYEKLLNDESRKVVELTLRKLAAKSPNRLSRYLKETEDESGSIGRRVRITWLELACIDKPKKYLAELVDYASPSFEFRTRINAIASLQAINHFDETVMAHLCEAVLQENGRLARPAHATLKHFLGQQAFARDFRHYLDRSPWTEAEKARFW
ncbi:MAG: M1 family metallopeptidase [Bacteroidia bacterium]|nr:M1 family metallopeptidase [Bacteroidia bacterium]